MVCEIRNKYDNTAQQKNVNRCQVICHACPQVLDSAMYVGVFNDSPLLLHLFD